MMDPFSERSAEELLAAFLEWRQLARAEQCDDGSSYLLLEVDAPTQAEVDRGY